MRATPQRDTGPELKLRRAVHALGLRYRVDHRPVGSLRRRADLVFTSARVAVFLDGCFWHGCPLHGTLPARNHEWWQAKIERTRQRDADTTAALERAGWTVVRVWEHDEPVAAALRIAIVVSSQRSAR